MNYEELKDGLDGIHAYDDGSTDSGIHDEALRGRIQTYFGALPPKEHRELVAKLVIELCLSPKALEQGYGPEDAKEFLTWLDEDMNCLITV